MEAILAYDIFRGIAKGGIIPWYSKKDMSFFYNLTKTNIVIMGSKTFFSIPENNRPLKNRLNIILTNKPLKYCYDDNLAKYNENVIFTNNVNIYNEILDNHDKYNEWYPFLNKKFKIFVIGGKQIYDQFIPLCKTVWVTQIKSNYNCDLVFDYDFKKDYNEYVYDNDNELIIYKYVKRL
jgi:dihydrofolate reductase